MQTIFKGNLKTAIVNERGTSYRVVFLNHYFETEEEIFFDTFNDAQSYAELWVSQD